MVCMLKKMKAEPICSTAEEQECPLVLVQLAEERLHCSASCSKLGSRPQEPFGLEQWLGQTKLVPSYPIETVVGRGCPLVQERMVEEQPG